MRRVRIPPSGPPFCFLRDDCRWTNQPVQTGLAIFSAPASRGPPSFSGPSPPLSDRARRAADLAGGAASSQHARSPAPRSSEAPLPRVRVHTSLQYVLLSLYRYRRYSYALQYWPTGTTSTKHEYSRTVPVQLYAESTEQRS